MNFSEKPGCWEECEASRKERRKQDEKKTADREKTGGREDDFWQAGKDREIFVRFLELLSARANQYEMCECFAL